MEHPILPLDLPLKGNASPKGEEWKVAKHVPTAEELAPRRARRPDAQPFDEVHIITVPRYKESWASGNEWRISACLQLKLKGKVMLERNFRRVEDAVVALPYLHRFKGAGSYITEDDTCDQESCAEPASVVYRLKAEFDDNGHKTDPYQFFKGPLIRKFCSLHKGRGDCGLEDAKRNYELVEN